MQALRRHRPHARAQLQVAGDADAPRPGAAPRALLAYRGSAPSAAKQPASAGAAEAAHGDLPALPLCCTRASAHDQLALLAVCGAAGPAARAGRGPRPAQGNGAQVLRPLWTPACAGMTTFPARPLRHYTSSRSPAFSFAGRVRGQRPCAGCRAHVPGRNSPAPGDRRYGTPKWPERDR